MDVPISHCFYPWTPHSWILQYEFAGTESIDMKG